MIQSTVHSLFCLTAAVLLQASNCTSSVGVGVDVDVDVDAETEEDSGAVVPTESIRVRFANQTPQALDVQFYAAANAVADVAAELFVDANRVTKDIGFAGTGLIPAGDTDEVTLACENARTIGTQGGRLVDPDSGQEIGTGDQRVAAVDLQYDCGDIITFLYGPNGERFTTTLVIE